ncbi:MAG: hypothetical protein A2284_09775 [Deltaproteobacteria bacterium RIFOXYA12_FULL_61_11]|nr:MAG: hypothetical protein A2284_09775 [Deltaproteobacteria bacterium RIFOXYA12_FULL_61_11]
MTNNPVLTSTLPVVEAAVHVTLQRKALTSLALRWLREQKLPPPWPDEHHLGPADAETTARYILLLDTLNFCFWPLPGTCKWTVATPQGNLGGYFGLSQALARWFRERPERTTAKALANVPEEEFEAVLAGEGSLQFLPERRAFTRALGDVLVERYGGSALRLLAAAKGSTAKLVELVVAELPGFDDRARYAGEVVLLRKRAQILCADLHGAFHGTGPGRFDDLAYLTAFADYKLPQLLERIGVLRYSPELRASLAAEQLLPAGSALEVELRAATVWAVELLRRELEARGRAFLPLELDWILWNDAKLLPPGLPYHRTPTVFY